MRKDVATKFGLYTGVVVIGYFLLFYIVRKPLMLSSGVYWASTFLFVGGMVWSCRLERKNRGDAGFSFPESLKTSFATYVVAAFLYHTWTYLMMAYFDPELVDIQKEMVIQQLERSNSLLGRELTEQVEDSFREKGVEVSISRSFFGLAQSLILGFILSLPIAYAHRTFPGNSPE